MKRFPRAIQTCILLLFGISLVSAQRGDLSHLRWRMIGPHRGGRTVGVAGIPDQPNVFYIGVNNGGVWRTSDYGRTWKPIFDDQPTGSVGAIAVAPSNPDILYVGSGEGLQRPDLSVGDGMFKSTDGGKTWQHVGLADALQIGAVVVDPRDPDRVFVAALGHPYGPNEERGVFRTTDGGGTWKKVLYKDENTGAIGLELDPSNPDIVYASLWAARQGPWENGQWEGKTSGLFKSTDGGSTWKQLTNGLPGADQGLGRIGIAVAHSDPSRIYLAVDAATLGGIYRSDDAGEHWALATSEGRVWGRGDDFAELFVDPTDRDVVYSGNVQTYKSTDGGKTFTGFKGAPGGDDYHTVWINPLHPEVMILAADQGAVVSVNGGRSWSSWYNQPTAQFYHVITDNQFPYNVYGGQQESGSVGIASRGNDGQITFREWHPVGADEYGYIAPDPLHPNLIYGGRVTRFDKSTGQTQNVAPEAVRSGKYRNLRTAPLMFSPLDPTALYYAANVLFRTTTGGMTWDVISPDLSRESPEVPKSVGIFATPELARQPRRGVIYALALSPLDASLIWAGTDDGLVHVTRDGGKNWRNVTPPALTSWSKVAGMDAGHFDANTAYAAVNRMKLDDWRPHIYRTHDGGATWQEIVAGLPESGPVNAVREDPVRKGLLFAGTERAVYVSFDDGNHWQSLRNNMPATSIRDLVIHDADIVVGTHGRSFWILDDISSLRQMDTAGTGPDARLYTPEPAVRVRWNMNTDTPLPPDEPAGENPPDGAILDYYLPADAREVTIEIADSAGNSVRKYSSSDVIQPVDEKDLRFPTYWLRPPMTVSALKGTHRFVWDLHYAPPENLPRSWPIAAVYENTASSTVGPWVLPGEYTVTLTVDGKSSRAPLRVKMDPRVTAPPEVIGEQFELSMICYRGLAVVQHLIGENHAIRAQIAALLPSVKDAALRDTLNALDRKLGASEGSGPPEDLDIVYTTVEDGKTVRNTLNGVQTRLLFVMMVLQGADAQPTAAQAAAARKGEDVVRAIHERWDAYRETDIGAVNRMLEERHLELLKTTGPL
jgi:photosystem II stability/assembly factor-like uncharacterized protein